MLHLLSLLALTLPANAWDFEDAEAICDHDDWESSDWCEISGARDIVASRTLDLTGLNVRIYDGGAIIADGHQVTIQMNSLEVESGGSLLGRGSDSRLNLYLSTYFSLSGIADFTGTDGGGEFHVYAGRDIEINAELLSANGAGTNPDASGGIIDLYAGRNLEVLSDISAEGRDNAQGGTIMLTAEGEMDGSGISYGELAVSGDLNLSGGAESGGLLIMAAGAHIHAACLASETTPTFSPIDINLSSRSGLGGNGGILWAHSAPEICINAEIESSGSGVLDDASGGSTIIEDADKIYWWGDLTSKAGATAGQGGNVWLEADNTIHVHAAIDLSSSTADGTGGVFDAVSWGQFQLLGTLTSETKNNTGRVSIAALQDLTIGGEISVGRQNTKGMGGAIELHSLGGELTVNQPINATGSDRYAGAQVHLSGCSVLNYALISAGSEEVSDEAEESLVDITAMDSMVIAGAIQAGDDDTVILRTPNEDTFVSVTGAVTPAPVTVYDPGLSPCTGVDDLSDRDGDGYASSLLRGEDCNDRDPSINPGVTEDPSDGIDNDCDGEVDESESGGDDTADPSGEDTADPSDDGDGDGDGDGDDTGEAHDSDADAATDTRGDKEGCGCSTTPAPSGLMLLLGLIPAFRRRD